MNCLLKHINSVQFGLILQLNNKWTKEEEEEGEIEIETKAKWDTKRLNEFF